MTIERLHNPGCGKPIKPDLKKNKANCSCQNPVAGAVLVTIPNLGVSRNPANPSQLGGHSNELAESVRLRPPQ